jgi:hypothetical protein
MNLSIVIGRFVFLQKVGKDMEIGKLNYWFVLDLLAYL